MTAVRERSSSRKICDVNPEGAADNIGSEELQDFNSTHGLEPGTNDL
jgi:hypothetical protein